jgi:hypothetical protein
MTDGADRLDARDPEVRATLERWALRRAAGPAPHDPPWMLPGWFGRASDWMVAQMVTAANPPSGPVTVEHAAGLSVVLRAEGPAGAMFLKCSIPLFGAEAVVTTALAAATPDLVTNVVTAHPNEGWLLMRDQGVGLLGDRPEDEWGSGVDVVARIQRAWIGRSDELVAVGVTPRSLEALATTLPDLAHMEPLATDFAADDRAAWDAAMPGFIAACESLDSLGPRPALLHGDLHPWNVTAGGDGAIRVFDWSDAAIAHPFLDLAVYVTRSADPGRRRALRDAYLRHWRDVLPADRLARAGDLAILVGTLYQVAGYVRIAAHMEADDTADYEGATASWARAAVATLTEGIDVRRPGHADG